MFLKSLNISGVDGEIRHIDFHKGVNLIVDNSVGENESGNNVGKTTILRLVDYCFGSSGKNLYTDPEFKTESEIKDFLIEQQVLITLVLAKNLDSEAAPKVSIERNFLKRPEKIQKINGETFTDKKFAPRLAELVFRHTEIKPTLRHLIAKNIRDEKSKLNHILKVLSPFDTDIQYETLYQFQFGVHSANGDAYSRAKDEHKKQETYKSQLSKQFNLSEFQLLPTLESAMEELGAKKDSLDLDSNYQQQLDEFDLVKTEIGRCATTLSTITLRKDLIEESRNSLEKDKSQVAVDEIQALYAEAKLLIPDLQKTFEESVHFHNQMIENKLEFITKELPSLTEEDRAIRIKLHELELQAEQYKELLHKDKTLVALEKINTDLNRLIERHAKLSEQNRIWRTCLGDLEKLNQALETFSDQAKLLNSQIAANLEVFNTSLKRIAQALYGQQYMLIRSEKDKNGKDLKTLQFEMLGVSSNPGTGEKKGHITAFDLAYIEFAEKLDIPHLNFIMHDQIENVDDRQIVTILEKLVPSINCQYIAPILKDKIPAVIDLKKYTVIELSQSEKLFKV